MDEVVNAFEAARAQISKVISGCEQAIDLSLVALLTQGHLLYEGPPGTAKTLLARCLASILGLDFNRLQFTPDLMPADILGTSVLDLETRTLALRKGPIFTDLLLADEVNRAPAKTQSALLQAMEEREISIDGTTHDLGQCFMVIATQNPIEMEGTYPLPEAQLDRFLFKILFDFPDLATEEALLTRHHRGTRAGDLSAFNLQPVADSARLATLRDLVHQVEVREEIISYVARLAQATRTHPAVLLGCSPRGALAMLRAAKAWAAKRGRSFVTPDDVKAVAAPALRHRLLLQPSALIEGLDADTLLTSLLSRVEVPR